MTNEEAIKLFEHIEILGFREVQEIYSWAYILDAIELAIKSLKETGRIKAQWKIRNLFDPYTQQEVSVVICSECKTAHKINPNEIKFMSYCSNCGSLMEGKLYDE